jgi:formylglycine-generating enzyme required for sulfatase activity
MRQARIPTEVKSLLLLTTACWTATPTTVRIRNPPQSAAVINIPAGTYIVGCDARPLCDNNPLRTITIGAFAIDRLQVLRSDYEHCVDEQRCPSDDGFTVADDLAIAIVAFQAAEAYCSWRGARLTSATEWEIAARGPSAHLYPWGINWHRHNLPQRGEVVEGHSHITYPIAGTRPDLRSVFGVEDMSGNAPEFVTGVHGAPQFRGHPASIGPLRAEDFTSVKIHFPRPEQRGAFRCVYIGAPNT